MEYVSLLHYSDQSWFLIYQDKEILGIDNSILETTSIGILLVKNSQPIYMDRILAKESK